MSEPTFEEELRPPYEEGVLLDVRGIRTYFFTEEGIVRALENVSYKVYEAKTLGIVGESGCGKSVSALSVMGIVPDPPGKIIEGEVWYRGEDLRKKSDAEMRTIRGNKMAMIFQDPMTSLNPVLTVGDQIMEAIRLHQEVDLQTARENAIKIMDLVGIPSAVDRVDDYPFMFSGGMRQRVMIAMSLSCNPELLIADEPTTALDVTIQAQILNILKAIRNEFNMSIMLITHDLGVIAELTDYVTVMYAGYIVEYASTIELFKNPMHPYSIALLGAIPKPDTRKDDDLTIIPGAIPNLITPPPGCRFHPRCSHTMDICKKEIPKLRQVAPQHTVRCHLFNKYPVAEVEEYTEKMRERYQREQLEEIQTKKFKRRLKKFIKGRE
ncbi:peptide ABC transporter ATP-binding protein [Candidatus Heimdallarchaeota archaeon]|nr:MAG: peptide ABC transporter ATP-binding protein [Candidatus Gerdarchaeota archaeon]RLI71755.1 MAG: peptide ABC transporter ATP-binding protein [Candidatus Gerdarchaeota archaeon]RLI73090.1 MAG: peptide ABC transporter ATP-binding protein [Candidatus Heimdallarchaeota archaeon]